VITDWIHGCLHENKISALTDGMEFRQFMYSVDCASGLITMMEMYNDLTPVTDLSTNQWTQIRDLAHLIATLSPQQNCSVEFSSVRANLDRSDPPNLSSPLYSKGWAPIHTLENAISELYAYYSNSSSCLSEPNHTYSSSDK
jgi:nucleoside-diphosphate-sugar epimerase